MLRYYDAVRIELCGGKSLHFLIEKGSHANEIDMRFNTQAQRRPEGTRHSKVHLSERRGGTSEA